MNIVSKLLLTSLLFSSCLQNEKNKVSGFYQADDKQLVIDGKLEPVEPDEDDNNSTLAGIDTNKDGIRDDIERMINRAFPTDSNEDWNLRQVHKQLARERQTMMVGSFDASGEIENMRKYFNSTECFHHINCRVLYPKMKNCVDKTSKFLSVILSLNVNTEKRLKRFGRLEAGWSGQVTRSFKAYEAVEACQFKIKE